MKPLAIGACHPNADHPMFYVHIVEHRVGSQVAQCSICPSNRLPSGAFDRERILGQSVFAPPSLPFCLWGR